jgi:hypothetical protein
MTVEQHDVVDYVGISPTKTLLLVISDHLPWDEANEHLWQLQEKLNRYFAFIESGELYEKFPQAVGLEIVIKVVLKYAVPETARWFFDRLATVIEEAGWGFEVQHLAPRTH